MDDSGSVEGYCPDYDSTALEYDRLGESGFAQMVLPLLEQWLLRHVAAGAHLLDLCCGGGRLARILLDRGYRVTGIDASRELLLLARQRAPEGRFELADARHFSLPGACDGALCTFSSLNHVLLPSELTEVFRRVHAALKPGARFVTDLLVMEGFELPPGKVRLFEGDDLFYTMRVELDRETGLNTLRITTFRRDGDWKRRDATVLRRIYSTAEVRSAAIEAGFGTVDLHRAAEALPHDLAAGRLFVVATKAERGGG